MILTIEGKLRQGTRESDIQSAVLKHNLCLGDEFPDKLSPTQKNRINVDLRRYGMKLCFLCASIKDLFDYNYNITTEDLLANICDECSLKRGRRNQGRDIVGPNKTIRNVIQQDISKVEAEITEEIKGATDMKKTEEKYGYNVDHQEHENMLTLKVQYTPKPTIYDDENMDAILDRQAKFAATASDLVDLRKEFSETMDFSIVAGIISKIGELQILLISYEEDLRRIENLKEQS